MKKQLTPLLLSTLILTPTLLQAQDVQDTKDINTSIKPSGIEESALKIVPLITSSPLLGTGIGAAASYLYSTDGEHSSKSQLKIGGQYSNTKSYNLFADNIAYFRNNSIISKTLGSYSSVNNEFDSGGESAEYNVCSAAISELLLYEAFEHFYIGGQLSYKNIKHDPSNLAGEEFLSENGVIDQEAGEFGLALSYDTRKSKYYPSDAT
jgi:hypothetical protein